MKKWTMALLVILLTWVVMMFFQSFIQSDPLSHLLGSNQMERKETLTHPSAGLTQLVVESKNGNVTLIGGDDENITIEAVYRARGGSEDSANERLERMTTETKQVEDRLIIQAVFDGTPLRESISYTITLPQSLVVQAETSNGSLEAIDLSEEVTLNTSNGRITVTSEQGPKNLVARTSNGSIRVYTVPTSGGYYNLRTSNGSVRVRLPENLGVSLNARTSNGSINVGRGQWNFTSGQQNRKQVEAQRGNGEFKLDIVTSNGSITLDD